MMKKLLIPLFIVAIFLIDQISKWWIVERYFQSNDTAFINWLVTFGQDRLGFVTHEVFSFFNLTMVWNTGISFGLFSGNEMAGVYVLSALSVIISMFSVR